MSFASVDELRTAVGTDLGTSDWIEVSQERIDQFAATTLDEQWIHVDHERAAAGPFGTTIAHGYLTLSLLTAMSGDILTVDGTRLAVNYGLGKVRFPAPVPAGSRIRGTVRLQSVDDVSGGVQVTTQVTVEREGGDKPVLVAESLFRLYA